MTAVALAVVEEGAEPAQFWFPAWVMPAAMTWEAWCAATWLGPGHPPRPRARLTLEERITAKHALEERRAEREREEVLAQRLLRRQQRLRWPRKCSTLPRARTLTAKALTAQERRLAEELAGGAWDAARPKTRADCASQPRPCPWVSCRFNLYLDVAENGRSVKINFPDREPGDMPAGGSCVLDVADRVALGDHMSLDEVGKLMNLGIERVRQISSLALQGARIKSRWEETLVKVRVPAAARRAP